MEVQLASLDVQGGQMLHCVEGRVRVVKANHRGSPQKSYVVKSMTFETNDEMNESVNEAYTMAGLEHRNFVSVAGIEVDSQRSTVPKKHRGICESLCSS